jgi:hypothetical protein
MAKRTPPCIAALLALAFILPSSALAKCSQPTTPQGNSEVQQYSETFSGGCGGGAIDRRHRSSGGGVPNGTQHRLNSRGPDGQATAELAQATSPDARSSAGASRGAANRGRGAQPASNGGGSVPKDIADALTGKSAAGDGMGALLPILLGATLVLCAGYALRHRLRS